MPRGKLYFGDNLKVLKGGDFPDESVDLVYLDPPFNSNRAYNVLFKERDLTASDAQIRAFEDTWHWDATTQRTFADLTAPDAPKRGVPPSLTTMIGALYEALPRRNDLVAYLVMMAPRLIELRRVLKPTGSLYLHCDATASHYLKLLLDGIFGPENFRNEIVWKRTGSHNSAHRFGPVHDSILCFSRGQNPTWNDSFVEYSEKYMRKFSKLDPETGRRFQDVALTGTGVRSGPSGQPWRGRDPTTRGRHWAACSYLYEKYKEITGKELEQLPLLERFDKLDEVGMIYWPKKEGALPRYKQFLEDREGTPLPDVWTDIDAVNSQALERLGYPTQKPLALLERVIAASSNPGDLVLDPFCGCGTTIEAAQKLGRRWIGIDITHLAITVVRDRLEKAFPGLKYDIKGEPQDAASARALAASSPYDFQWWAVDRIGAHPQGGELGRREGRRGADRGIDGFIKFRVEGKVHDLIVSVKGGTRPTPAMVRELAGTIGRRAAIGVLITAYPPSKEMKRAAAEVGFFEARGEAYPRIQLLSVDDLFAGKTAGFPDEPEGLPANTALEERGVLVHRRRDTTAARTRRRRR